MVERVAHRQRHRAISIFGRKLAQGLVPVASANLPAIALPRGVDVDGPMSSHSETTAQSSRRRVEPVQGSLDERPAGLRDVEVYEVVGDDHSRARGAGGLREGAGWPVDRPAVKPVISETRQAGEGWKVSGARPRLDAPISVNTRCASSAVESSTSKSSVRSKGNSPPPRMPTTAARSFSCEIATRTAPRPRGLRRGRGSRRARRSCRCESSRDRPSGSPPAPRCPCRAPRWSSGRALGRRPR